MFVVDHNARPARFDRAVQTGVAMLVIDFQIGVVGVDISASIAGFDMKPSFRRHCDFDVAFAVFNLNVARRADRLTSTPPLSLPGADRPTGLRG